MESVLAALIVAGFGFLGVLVKRGNDRMAEPMEHLSKMVSEVLVGQAGQDTRLGIIEHKVNDLYGMTGRHEAHIDRLFKELERET